MSKRGSSGLTKIGDIPRMKALAREVGPPTAAQQKLLDAAEEIREYPDAVEAAYMARQLVQCTLPHTNPGKVEAWMRRSGSLSLIIQPGWDAEKNCSLGYPYGSIPRLLLFWMVTEAIRTKDRRLKLGRSLAQFMRDVGLDPNTGRGKRGDAKRLRNQMERLFGCHIGFQMRLEHESGAQGKRWLNMEVAPAGEYWWDPKQPNQLTLMESWIELGEKFYEAISAAPVPVDMRALRALKRSPLALDLYAWATYQTFIVTKKGKPFQFVSWETLMRQLGTDYADASNFKKKALRTLRKVKAVYPALMATQTDGGLMVFPGLTAVPSR